MKRRPTAMIAAGAMVCLLGSSSTPADTGKRQDQAATDSPAKVTNRVTSRAGNRKGEVLVLMYHRTGPIEKYMVRSKKNFLKDLNRLYALGFRPVTLNDYANNTMDLPRGASPVVLTFDDSDPSQFKLVEGGAVDSNTFVGIWQGFAKKHPDFPVKGTFFILPNGPFGKGNNKTARIQKLKDLGCEIGSHTLTHRPLNKLSDAQVTKELGGSYQFIKKLGFEATSMATPYGIAPKKRSLLSSCVYNGKTVRYANICLAGSSPAKSPLDKSFDRRYISRVQAYDGPLGITYWLNATKSGKFKPYVQP